mmetsp:Transcript_20041/g.36800  ORF Transcript_20041/g.36800 Transcript_20041/m.36800 type:complete len:92 (+) Transcript_20041:543-818(+)
MSITLPEVEVKNFALLQDYSRPRPLACEHLLCNYVTLEMVPTLLRRTNNCGNLDHIQLVCILFYQIVPPLLLNIVRLRAGFPLYSLNKLQA